MLCVLCLIVLWGFSLVTSYSGVIDSTFRLHFKHQRIFPPRLENTGAGREVGAVPACPVSMEEFQAEGPNRPVMLTVCGHTFSYETVSHLVRSNRSNRHIKCPMCQQEQPGVLTADDAPTNWAMVSLVEELRGPALQPRSVGRRRGSRPSAPPMPAVAAHLGRNEVRVLRSMAACCSLET